ncbi:unnamed protein product [Dimorphilus gyrociliatus]|uniref:Uncharacterized protein n=1 Tax=Dimorphilus gyrociliatus TaxID=2664684 RepID=A0A7I8VZ10_9ANNE|nr:unnamed protein product [Dimorphilus gyrociliatus]
MIAFCIIVTFLFDRLCFNGGSDVFESCTEAFYYQKGKNDEIFQIQPLESGNISSIRCRKENDTFGIAFLDNNSEDLTLLSDSRYAAGKSFVKDIIYEDFNENELNSFLKTTTFCRQGMKIETFETSVYDQSFVFWDGLQIEPTEASIDGVCNCFISKRCIDESNIAAGCYMTGGGQQWFTDEGYFSVKSSRLPIKTLLFGDVDHESEKLKYQVWKLECLYPLYTITIPDLSTKCKENNSQKQPIIYDLMDNKLESCLYSTTNPLVLRIENSSPFSSFQIIGKEIKDCEYSITAYSNNGRVCNEIANCIFHCDDTKMVDIQIFKKIDNDQLVICDVMVI